MNFGFNEEQELLRSTARKFFDNECGSETVRKLMEGPEGMTLDLWKKLAEQGWLGLIVPDEHGGMGLGMVDLVVLMEEMGRAVVPGPFFSTVLLGGLAILEAGTEAQKKAWLPRLASGDARATLAWMEPTADLGARGITLPATAKSGGHTLNGTKLFVQDAHTADALVVAARTATGNSAEDMTVEYAKIRQAFGRPIGSYQGVKHKAADMLVDVENSKSITYYAAWAMDEGVAEGPLAVSMAKAYVSDAYRRVSGAGIQLHGGIGFTWEHDLHLYFKRAKGSEFTFGDATWHRERVAQLVNL